MCECDAPVSVGSAKGVSRFTRLLVPNCNATDRTRASMPSASPLVNVLANSSAALVASGNEYTRVGAGIEST